MDLTTITAIISALYVISEALSLIPAVKANGIFQLLWNVLKIAAGEKKKED